MNIQVVSGPAFSKLVTQDGDDVYQAEVAVALVEHPSSIIAAPTKVKAQQARIYARACSVTEALAKMWVAVQVAVDADSPTEDIQKAMNEQVDAAN